LNNFLFPPASQTNLLLTVAIEEIPTPLKYGSGIRAHRTETTYFIKGEYCF